MRRRSTGRKHLTLEWEEEDTQVIPRETMEQTLARGTVPMPVLPRVKTRPMGSRRSRVNFRVGEE